MPILLQIYFYCVIGACIYIVLVTWISKTLLKEDEEFEYVYNIWDSAPLRYKLLGVLVPVINLVFSLLALFMIFIKLKGWWFDLWTLKLGHFVVKQFTKTGLSHFRIKEWIVRTFFFSYIDTFYKCRQYDAMDAAMKIITKLAKHEKAESKSESEQETKPQPDDTNKEVFVKGEEDNPN